MRVLVTGSSGFLGRSLMPLLNADVGNHYSAVIGWDRKVFGDFLSAWHRKRAIELAAPDVVVHLAWLDTSSPDYENDPDNTTWARSTIDFARQVTASGLRFFGVGSMIEDEAEIRSAYAAAKRSVARAILEGKDEAGLVAWCRPSWVFNFSELRPRLIRAHVKSLKARGSFAPANPSATRDFIHSSDVANALKCLIDYSAVGSWDVGAGHATSVVQLLASFDEWQRHGPPRLDEAAFREGSWSHVLHGPRQLAAFGWLPRETARYLASFWSTESGMRTSPREICER